MTRHAILQIGTEKTGTTTLQAFLAQNRDALAARGYLYPRFCGEQNHTGLAAYAMDEDKKPALRQGMGCGSVDEIPAFRARMESEAAVELADVGTVVFCNEHCHSRLNTADEVARLQALLEPHFDRIDVCVYLRRQDQVALSLYSTRLKSGNTNGNILPRTTPDDPYYNYDVFLGLWEQAFGREHVHVRLFDRSELLGGDVVADFLAAWGMGTPADYAPVGKMNESIRPEAQDYLRRINAFMKPIGGLPIDTLQGPISSELARVFPGRGARPARAEARAFYDKFRASNAAVRRRYFPARERLFDDSFDNYPETADRQEFDADTVAEIAAGLHMAHVREMRRLEAEIAIREGRLAWERGRREAAIGTFRRAVSTLPDYADAHRALAEYLHRAERSADAVAPARRAVELRPAKAEYWHFLGVALRASGSTADALAAQERAFELDPSHEGTCRALESLRAETAPAAAHAAG